jgi:hypothetical protein
MCFIEMCRWVLWVSLSIMLSEALVSLFVLLAKTGYQYYKRVPTEPVEDPAPEDQQVPRKVWVTGNARKVFFFEIKD